MIKCHILTDSDGRIISSTKSDVFATEEMQIIWVPDDFNFLKQGDYIYKDGELIFDGKQSQEEDKQKAEQEFLALQSSQVVNAISLFAQTQSSTFTDRQAFEISTFFAEYSVGVQYKKNEIIRYDGDLYRIGQDHTSQEQWVPGTTGTEALYSKIEITQEGYEIWKEYDGVSGVYSKEQIVRDPTDNRLYKSKIDTNVWGPPSEQPDYWEIYTEEE